MTVGHETTIDVGRDSREDQRRWWRLSFLAEEVEYAAHHLRHDVLDARDEGWSWRRIAAATGVAAETLRWRYGTTGAEPLDHTGETTASGEGAAGGRPARTR